MVQRYNSLAVRSGQSSIKAFRVDLSLVTQFSKTTQDRES